MTLQDIANARLYNQQLTKTDFKTAQGLVSWMGAVQAQDLEMSKWALGIRLRDSSLSEIEKAMDDGKIIRTHVLRPTWHLVSPHDIYWMLDLSAQKIRSTMSSNNKSLELTEAMFKKSRRILEKSLVKAGRLTREEIRNEFTKAKIKTDNNRLSHILVDAELNGLICSGAAKGKKQTYALLEERVPKNKQIKKEEALQKLAEKYFQSHGPATLKDFTWWSGLGVKDAIIGLNSIKTNLVSEGLGSETYYFYERKKQAMQKNSAFLIPAFDEFLISYKDRTASISNKHFKTGTSINGIFYPLVLVNGQATGTWKRSVVRDTLQIQICHFQEEKAKGNKLVLASGIDFKKFLGVSSLVIKELKKASTPF